MERSRLRNPLLILKTVHIVSINIMTNVNISDQVIMLLPSDNASAGAYTATAVYRIICSMYRALAYTRRDLQKRIS